ncbi:hypothetical protein [Bacillus sp. NEB1478]|nr:hypothetical protein [Bacillus sp. NEB1478]WNB90945.1 hypothetical protein RGB74_13635 [Bacillus sp. NEB1478]
MKINKKIVIGVTIVLYSVFGFAKNAESPPMKASIETIQISEALSD